jgi:hypothetical protein
MDGLAALVKEQLQADPFSGVIFCFVASVPNAFAAAIPSLKADDRQVFHRLLMYSTSPRGECSI